MLCDILKKLPDNWRVRRLSDISLIIDSLHKTPDYITAGYPMVRVTDVRGGFLDLSNALRVDEEVFKEFTKRHRPRRGDIVFSRVGTYGNTSYVKNDIPFCLGQNTALIVPRINSRFLFICLQSSAVRHQIEQFVVGSTQKTISLKNISSLLIPIPPKPELEAIAHILGTLDDKIELNRRMNETLEAMARAIFKSWFVDFDPVRAKAEGRHPDGLDADTAALFPDSFEDSRMGEIPKGWVVGTVGDLGKVICGKTPPTSDHSNYGDDIPFITIPDMHDKVFITKTSKKLSFKGEKTQLNKTLPQYSICVSCIATPGLTAITCEPSQTNQQINSIIPAQINTSFYCYYILHRLSDEIMSSGSGGSVFMNLNKGNFSNLSIILPEPELMISFNKKVAPFLEKILLNDRQSRTLAAIRDALLPKLLSGEVRVKEVERFLES